jgi:molecular chaperone GrpE (heat shock protein)
MDLALDWVKDNGIASQKEYPYRGVDQTCKEFTSVLKDAGCTDVKADSADYSDGSVDNLIDAVANHGVLSIAVAADFKW